MHSRTFARRAFSAVALVSAAAVALTGCVFVPALLNPPTGPVDPTDPTSTEGFDPTEGVDEALVPFYEQEVEWSSCEGGTQCAVIEAPMDWFNPDPDKTVEVHFNVQEATGEAQGHLLYNPGGPGASGFDYVAQYADYLVPPEIRESYNLVGFDPRGVARSTPITCYDDPETLYDWMFATDDGDEAPEYDDADWLSDEALDQSREGAKEFAEACEQYTGEAISYFGTEQAASDMDLIRALLGEEQLDYYGVSYGTLLGATYAGLFPENVGRFVLDAAVSPESTDADGTLFQAKGFELALGNFLEDCIAGSDCPIDASSRQGALDEMTELFDELDKKPLKGSNDRLLGGSNFFTSIAANLYAEFQWPVLREIIGDVMDGDATSAFTAVDEYYGVNPDGTFVDNSFEALVGINCLDYAPESDYDVIRDNAEIVQEEAPTVGRYFSGLSSCLDWPNAGSRDQSKIEAPGANPIIVIGGINDPATPYEQSVSLADQLESGVLITVSAEGHGQYGQGNACVDGPVSNYLLTGDAPTADIDNC